jgi:hypothetical protein
MVDESDLSLGDELPDGVHEEESQFPAKLLFGISANTGNGSGHLKKEKTIILENDYNRTRIYAQPWLIVVSDSVLSKPVCLSQPNPSTLVYFGIKAPIFPEPVFPKDFISFLSPSFIKAKHLIYPFLIIM